MGYIRTELPPEVVVALASACGFKVSYERRPGEDKWVLSAGHGVKRVEHVGTKEVISAFLSGYASMQMQTTQILIDMEIANRKLLQDMRDRFASLTTEQDKK